MKALDSILLSTRPILITPWSISCSLWQEYLRSYDDDNYLDESWMDEYNLLHVLRISRWGCPHRQITNLGITTTTHPLTRNNRVVFLLLTCICLGPVQTAVSLCQNARCIGQNARCPVPIFAASTCAALFCSTLAVGGIPPTTCTFPHPPILIRSTKTQTCKLGCNVQLHVGACATSTSPHPPQLTIPLQRTALAH